MSMSDEKRAHDSGLQGEPDAPDGARSEPKNGGEPAATRSSVSDGSSSTAGGGSPQPRPGASDQAAGQTERHIREDPVRKNPVQEEGVYFFPEETVTASEVRALIESGSRDDQARVVSHLLTYAEYAEIWTWVDRDLVRDLFDDLQMPDRLRTAWARNLGLVAKSG